MMDKSTVIGPEEPPAGTIEAKIEHVIRTLRHCLDAVLQGLPDRPRRSSELASSLKLSKTLSNRLHKALGLADPFGTAHVMPGPEALRMVLEAAARNGGQRSTIAAAEQAVSAFEQLIQHDTGGRNGLDAIISASLPDARRSFELASKQAMFKGAANLKGAMIETHCTTCLVHPGEDAERHDVVILMGLRGLRRIRPGALVQVSNRYAGPDGGEGVGLTLNGKRVETLDGLLLKPYCSLPLPKLDTYQAGVYSQYVVADEWFGPDSAVDITLAEVRRAALIRYQPADGHRTSGIAADVEQPAKTLVFDFLLHEEVWPDSRPELRIYDTVTRGRVNPNDRGRDIDLLDLAESIEFLGRGPAKFRAAEIPDYPAMLRYVCGKLGWNVEAFRGYRCCIQYPFYGSQVCMVFDPPERPRS